MITVSLQVARAALMREESRGGHSRLDHPKYDEYWAEHNIVISADGGDMVLECAPRRQVGRAHGVVEARQEAERV